MLAGTIFTGNARKTTDELRMVFLPLGLAEEDDQMRHAGIVFFYEHMSRSLPRSFNGKPMFLSVNMLNQEDYDRLDRTTKKLLAAVDAVTVEDP